MEKSRRDGAGTYRGSDFSVEIAWNMGETGLCFDWKFVTIIMSYDAYVDEPAPW